MTDTEMQVADWLTSDDTGLSSRFMARILSGLPPGDGQPYHPYDTSDFGRCHRLLEKAPALRSLLPRMAGQSDIWKKLVENWDEITKLYLEEEETNHCIKAYNLMKSLGC